MGKDFTAMISGDSARARAWRDVFRDEVVYLQSPAPQEIVLPEIGQAFAYMLDVDLLTDEQRARLVQHLARKFRLDEGFVDEQIDAVGVPILARDVTVTIENPQKWVC